MSPHFDDISIFPVLFLFAIAGLTAYYAKFKGRSPVGWFFLTLLFSIFAPIILMFLPRLNPDGSAIKEDGDVVIPVAPTPSDLDAEEKIAISKEVNRPEGEDKLWYYMNQAYQQTGPVSVIALRELWHTGLLELNTYVWCEGMPDWKKVDELPELKAILNKSYVM